jgi:hypothetical protein
VAENPIPHVVARLAGVSSFRAPPKPKFIIRINSSFISINGIVRARGQDSSSGESNLPQEGDDIDSDGDLLDEVNQWMDKHDTDIDATDQEDAPDWMFEEGEVASKDTKYTFCPAWHRRGILLLFTKHFVQHMLFPERLQDGIWDAETICRNAAWEMYDYCYKRGLREAWGYLWTSWYSPKRWSLWARSSSPRISRLRTTMCNENFFKNLKGTYLHDLLHPRLDQLVWIIIHQVVPVYAQKIGELDSSHRAGRSKPLTTFQRAFFSNWKKLERASVSGREYETDVKRFTCNCGRQKYDSHHLCKHLVQRIPEPPMAFWQQVIRRRTMPIYRHPCLVDKTLPATSCDESVMWTYSIADGDDVEEGREDDSSPRLEKRPHSPDTFDERQAKRVALDLENGETIEFSDSEDEEEVRFTVIQSQDIELILIPERPHL